MSSSTLIPTGGLRFSLRQSEDTHNGVSFLRDVRILQTLFLDLQGRDVWLDVPTVDHRERTDG